MSEHRMRQFLLDLGCRPNGERRWTLDGFDHDFYLEFDGDHDRGRPDTSIRTVDVLICRLGSLERHSIRIKTDCQEHHVYRLLAALGVNRFPEKTRKAFYDWHRPLRSDSG